MGKNSRPSPDAQPPSAQMSLGQAGDAEIIADEISSQVLAKLSAGVAELYPQVA